VPAWLIWIIAAAALASAEALSLDLVLVMCAGGAGAGAIAAGLGAPAAGQVATALVVGVGLLLFVRPIAKRHLSPANPGHRSGSAGLVGLDAVALTRVDDQGGRVRLRGGEWSARAFDRAQRIEPGEVVRVMEIDGATAVVWDPKSI
jgi:membrane protein implicated in regulation of membrane protease activity